MVTKEQILDSINIIREARENDNKLNVAFKKFDDINEIFSMSGKHEQWIVDKIDADIKACTGFVRVYSIFVYDWQFLEGEEGTMKIETEDNMYFIDGVESFINFIEGAKDAWDGEHIYTVSPVDGTVIETFEEYVKE